MKRPLIIIFFILQIVFIGFSQNGSKVDSLTSLLEETKVNADKIKLCNELSLEFKNKNPDQAIEYATQAIDLALTEKNQDEAAIGYYNKAIGYYYKGIPDSSMAFYTKSLELKTQLNDSAYMAKLYYNMGMILHSQGDLEQAVIYYQQALDIEEAIGNKDNIARALNVLGIINMHWQNIAKARELYDKALKMYRELGNRPGEANTLLNIGLTYFQSFSTDKDEEEVEYTDEEKNEMKIVYDKAIKYYEEALAVYLELNYPQGISLAYNNLGATYKNLKDFDKAIEYTEKSLEISEKIGDKRSMALSYGNLGIAYERKKDFYKAMEYNQKSMHLASELRNIEIKKQALKAYSDIYKGLGQYEKALSYYRKYNALRDSLFNDETQKQFAEMQTKYETAKKEQEIALLNKDTEFQKKQIEQQQRLIIIFVVISIVILLFLIMLIRLFSQKKKANKKLEKLNAEILNQNEEILQQKEEILTQAEQLRLINVELEKLSIVASETDNSVIIADASGRIEWVNEGFTRLMGYTLEEFIAENGDNMITNSGNGYINDAIQESINKMRSAVYTSITKTKGGESIWLQTTLTPILDMEGKLSKLVAIDSDISKIKEAEEEIKKQRDLITEQRQEILDSIHYARRIQTAVLPPDSYLDQALNDHFIFYKPRDIVSGDFYWFAKRSNKVVITAVDCTGHGVPGAFMSMLGVSFLNEVVNKRSFNNTEESINAGEILNQLRNLVINSLHQTGRSGESKDGMDMALCILDLETNDLEYAGANNPIYIIHPDKASPEMKDDLDILEEIKPDKMPIGFYHSQELIPFTTKRTKLKPGECFYVFSDGFADQFGGPAGKKFKYKPFKKLLVQNHNKQMFEQKAILDREFDFWKNHINPMTDEQYEQVDDIILIGVRV